MAINLGKIEGESYIKHVDFSKAVLWMTKELSLRTDIFDRLLRLGVKELVFVGTGKTKESWVFDIEDVNKAKTAKTVGQERQYYFPINLRKKTIKVQNGI